MIEWRLYWYILFVNYTLSFFWEHENAWMKRKNEEIRINRTRQSKGRRFLGQRSRQHLTRFGCGVLCRGLGVPPVPPVGSEEWHVLEEQSSPPATRWTPPSPASPRWLRPTTIRRKTRDRNPTSLVAKMMMMQSGLFCIQTWERNALALSQNGRLLHLNKEN